MGLLGSGAMAIFYDAGDDTEHNKWHSHEHLMERVGITGFLRGRRYVSITGSPKHFILYEALDISVFSAEPYLERLNHPSADTKRIIPTLRNMNRTLCRVAASFGMGVGSQLLALRLAPISNHAEKLKHWLVSKALPDLVQQYGLISVSLMEGDKVASGAKAVKKNFPRQAVEIADWTIIVDAYDIEAIKEVSGNLLSPATLEGHGASGNQIAGIYHLMHIASNCDIPIASQSSKSSCMTDV